MTPPTQGREITVMFTEAEATQIAEAAEKGKQAYVEADVVASAIARLRTAVKEHHEAQH